MDYRWLFVFCSLTTITCVSSITALGLHLPGKGWSVLLKEHHLSLISSLSTCLYQTVDPLFVCLLNNFMISLSVRRRILVWINLLTTRITNTILRHPRRTHHTQGITPCPMMPASGRRGSSVLSPPVW